MKRSIRIVLLGVLLAFGLGTVSYAGEIDLLLRKLVEKGVLTAGEAQEIVTETKEEIKKEIAAAKNDVLPKWIQTMKLKGDFRLRYQFNHGKTVADQTSERHRGRIRLRAGVESKVNEKLLVAFGLATGTTGDSPTINKDQTRSTNQSFTEAFGKKPINLDYAYAQYTPFNWVTLIGGKIKNPLWEPGDLIWDTDITPEGGAAQLSKKLNSKSSLFMNMGVLVINEDSTSGDDPTMYMVQPGLTYNLNDSIALKSAVSYYYTAVKGKALRGTASTNNLPLEDFANITPALELTIKEPLKALGVGFLNVPFFSVFGEYVENAMKSKKESGFMTGLKFGAEKIANWGDWQFKYNFGRLERDAVADILPDSDRYEGQTGIRSHEMALDYGLGTNTWLSLDCYRSQRLASPKSPETVVQVDWNMKF